MYIKHIKLSVSRPNARNIAIIVTDGESNDKDATLRQARTAREAGIHMMSVGIGKQSQLSHPHAQAHASTANYL